ncbi:molybdopterin molybdenumtransferase MoeA, partial [Verrucomicrobia bacterium]|nr:molybdopterin molybdenumtransferase MoeA [Verrucomicrobiota bacterium]
MLALEKAIEKSLELIKQLDSEKIDLINSAGHFNSSNIISPFDLPGFDNSAMDGFAIINSDLKQATKSKPKSLECIEISPAGTFPTKDIKSGTCIRVFTGSPIPLGANAVIMQEDCNIEKNNIIIKNQVKPWDNIRIKGEDIRKGDKLI